MIDNEKLSEKISKLLEFARSRNSDQGVIVYEASLKKLDEASSASEIDDLVKKLRHALSGIEAHGYFTDEEYKIVQEIRSL